jgi:hypothetical protein
VPFGDCSAAADMLWLANCYFARDPLGSRPCADSAMRNLVAFALASRMFLNLADFKGMRTRMRFSVKTGRVAAPGARHPFFERASN